ncbi:hypothetical protein PS005_24895, partial [Shigella sonnei]|nr:hypothetical protein [Shigella sonnei]
DTVPLISLDRMTVTYNYNPRGKRIVVVCDSHTVKRYQGYCVLTATFRHSTPDIA